MDIEGKKLSINDPLPICRNCKTSCCTDSEIGVLIPTPLLTVFDIERIQRSGVVGTSDNKFFEEYINPVTGNTIIRLKNIEGSGCVFFNHKVKRCGIFENRPLDCRLFPLDIIKIGNKYVWMLHNQCHLPEDIIPDLLESAKKEILPYLRDYLPDYSTLPMKIEEQCNWRVLEVLS